MDPNKCKEQVRDGASYIDPYHQCHRKVVIDGYCRQHHPDAVTERRRKSKEEYDRKWALRQEPYDALKILHEIVLELKAGRRIEPDSAVAKNAIDLLKKEK